MKTSPDYRSIDPEKAKELLKSGKAKRAKGSGLFDVPSMLISLGVFAILFIGAAIYIEYFVDNRIMKDYVPQKFPTEQLSEISANATKISNLIQNGYFTKADSLLQFELYKEKPEVLDEQLWCYAIELRLAGKRYEEAIEMSRTVQSRFPKNAIILASLFWYKAHAYYYLGKYREAYEQLQTLQLLQDERYTTKAQEYQDAIYDLIRTDGIQVFFE
jgi:tetratricopeptide (TPR) repeat protein